MTRTILQLGAGKLQRHSVHQLKAAGYIVHVVDRNPQSPAFADADASAAISTTDRDGIRDYASDNRVDLILALNDAGAGPAADVSDDLGLPNISPQTARNATDKGLMRECWAAASLSQPSFLIVSSPDDIRTAVAAIGFPCILKPTLNWGSRGISSLFTEADLDFAVDFARNNDRNGRYIIEGFVEGIEMTIEGLAKDGDVVILSKSDKVHQAHPRYRVAMQLNYPSTLPAGVLQAVDRLVSAAARALGITDGAIHCEVIVNPSGVFLVEMAARPGGGHIFGQIVEAQSGVPMPVTLAKIFLDEPVDLRPRFQKGVSYRFFAPPPGIFESVDGIQAASRREGVLDIGFDMVPGTKTGSIEGDADRPGYLVTQAADQQSAIALADDVIASLRFEMAS